jgi:hypothetical protein
MGHLRHIAMVTDTLKNDGRIMTYESEYYSLNISDTLYKLYKCDVSQTGLIV